MDTAATGVHVRSSALLGRQEEVQRVEALLQSGARLVTLRGPGGIGKTTLATHLARRVRSEYDAVLLVDLSGERDAAKVIDVIAAHLPEPGYHYDSVERIAHFVGEQRVLLILDNFEQVVDAAADLTRLLDATWKLQLLVTSRVALHVHAEHDVEVKPLALASEPERALESAAVQLFVQRARQVNATFEVDDTSTALINDIVRRLEGLPLAIELAATRLRTFSLVDLASRLERPLEVLKSDFRDRPERLRSLRAALSWSYDLLSEEDRAVFECCAIFDGSVTPRALEAVWGTPSVLDRVEELLAQSLLWREDVEGTQWRMLQPLRELALERLEHQPLAETWRERHAHHYLTVVQALRHEPPGMPPEQYLPQYANMRAGLTWAIERRHADLALQYLDGLHRVWVPYDLTEEGWRLARQALSLPVQTCEHLVPRALKVMLECMLSMLEDDEVARSFEEGAQTLVQVSRRQGDVLEELYGHLILGVAENRWGRLHRCVALNVDLAERCEALLALSRHERPATLSDAALMNLCGHAYRHAFMASADLGLIDQARAYAAKARDLRRRTGNAMDDGADFIIADALGQYDEAVLQSALAELRFATSKGLWRIVRGNFEMLARAASATGHVALAVQFLAFGARVCRGVATHDFGRRSREVERRAQETLGRAAFEAAWQAGSVLTPNDALRLAETFAVTFQGAGTERPSTSSESRPPRTGDRGGSALTQREVEVLALVAQGHPDRRIAKLLNISPTTVSKHVSHMLSKLGLRNRTELARWATEQQFRT